MISVLVFSVLVSSFSLIYASIEMKSIEKTQQKKKNARKKEKNAKNMFKPQIVCLVRQSIGTFMFSWQKVYVLSSSWYLACVVNSYYSLSQSVSMYTSEWKFFENSVFQNWIFSIYLSSEGSVKNISQYHMHIECFYLFIFFSRKKNMFFTLYFIRI